MNKNTAGSVFDDFLLFRVIALVLLVTGIATASFSMLIAAGIVTYGWPYLCVHLLNSNARRETPRRISSRLLELTRRAASVLSVPFGTVQ
ncbi:MAG: hypothetical protein LBC91_01255 [Candidatus Accumulibacter sp.]|jgi:hypothetical protein|nr:hypothetical protein [Accumulibacter sp.]